MEDATKLVISLSDKRYVEDELYHIMINDAIDWVKVYNFYEKIDTKLSNYILGFIYLGYSNIFEYDEEKAIHHFEKAIEQGSGDSHNLLGNIIAKTDPSVAVIHYMEAEKHETKKAYANLGNVYENGLGVKKNNTISLKYYAIGAKKNEMNCLIKMGLYYEKNMYDLDGYTDSESENEDERDKNLNEAIRCYESSLKIERNKVILTKLGVLYGRKLPLGPIQRYSRLNNSMKKNFKKIEKYFKEAVSMGYTIAMYQLGSLYLRYRETLNEAFNYFNMEIKNGGKLSCRILADIYSSDMYSYYGLKINKIICLTELAKLYEYADDDDDKEYIKVRTSEKLENKKCIELFFSIINRNKELEDENRKLKEENEELNLLPDAPAYHEAKRRFEASVSET